MTNILVPVSVFIVGCALSLLAARFAVVCFLVGAVLNIVVNRRTSSKSTRPDNADRHALLIRSSYALMAPSFTFVAVIFFGASGEILDRTR